MAENKPKRKKKVSIYYAPILLKPFLHHPRYIRSWRCINQDQNLPSFCLLFVGVDVKRVKKKLELCFP